MLRVVEVVLFVILAVGCGNSAPIHSEPQPSPSSDSIRLVFGDRSAWQANPQAQLHRLAPLLGLDISATDLTWAGSLLSGQDLKIASRRAGFLNVQSLQMASFELEVGVDGLVLQGDGDNGSIALDLGLDSDDSISFQLDIYDLKLGTSTNRVALGPHRVVGEVSATVEASVALQPLHLIALSADTRRSQVQIPQLSQASLSDLELNIDWLPELRRIKIIGAGIESSSESSLFSSVSIALADVPSVSALDGTVTSKVLGEFELSGSLSHPVLASVAVIRPAATP